MKYTQTRVDALAKLIRDGVPVKDACTAVGIGEATYFKWVNQKVEFRERIEKAKAQAIADRVKIIKSAAKKQWQAAAWWLERRYREAFGDRRALDVHHTNDPNELSDDELARIAESGGRSASAKETGKKKPDTVRSLH